MKSYIHELCIGSDGRRLKMILFVLKCCGRSNSMQCLFFFSKVVVNIACSQICKILFCVSWYEDDGIDALCSIYVSSLYKEI